MFFSSIIDNSRSTLYDSKSILDDSRSKIDNSKSIIDDFGLMLQLLLSCVIIIYNCQTFIVQAHGFHTCRDGSGLIFLGLGRARVSYFGLRLFRA